MFQGPDRQARSTTCWEGFIFLLEPVSEGREGERKGGEKPGRFRLSPDQESSCAGSTRRRKGETGKGRKGGGHGKEGEGKPVSPHPNFKARAWPPKNIPVEPSTFPKKPFRGD